MKKISNFTYIHPPPTPPEIFKTNIFSCDEMWQGIIVEDGGILNMDGFISATSMRNCKISDAVAAIYCPGNTSGSIDPTLIINTVEFSNNLIAIEAENVDLQSAQIRGCDFNATSGMLTKLPNEGVYPQNHIRLENVTDFSLGEGSSISTNMLNEFSGVNMGIFANESSLLVTISEFYNLINYAVSPPQKGIGINAQNGTITARTIEVDSRFRNLQRGIFTRGNFDVTIQGCDHFRDIDETAISINSMNYQNTITITDNPQFQRANIGIRVTGGKLSSVTISNNKLNNTDFIETNSGSFHNTAITVQKWSTNLFADNVTIFDNEITNYRIGIHANNVNDISIGADLTGGTKNTINFNKGYTGFMHGIWIENCPQAKIQSNEITQNSTTMPSGLYTVDGITIDECQNGFINLNEINEVQTPIHVIGSCDYTELHCNDIINNSNEGAGVFLNFAVLPEQGNAVGNISWDNSWEGYSSSVYGVTGTPGSSFDWPWDNSDQKFNPNPDPSSVLISATPLTSPTTFGCVVVGAPDDHDRDLRYGPVVDDTLRFAAFEEEFIYKSKQCLFNLIQSDPTLLVKNTSKDSLFSNFKINIGQTNIGKFYTVDSLLMLGDLDAAESANNSITDTTQAEANLKTLNSLLTNKILRDSILNNIDTLSLEEIAWQNPITGGKAVFMARALLFLEIHSENYALRIGLLNDTSTLEESNLVNHFSLAPNPANSLCSVYFENIQRDFVLTLKNLMGQTLIEKKVVANTLSWQIPISSFAAGMYVVIIKDNIKMQELKKLIIVR